MEVVYQRCAGVDVHQRFLVVCLSSVEGGELCKEIRSFSTETADLLAFRAWLVQERCSAVGMESTGVYWMPVYRRLEGFFELIVANAQHIKAVPGRKTDIQDADWIADWLQHGLLTASFVPSQEQQDLRDLTRLRVSLVQERARLESRVHKVLDAIGCQLSAVLSDILGFSGKRILQALCEGESDPVHLARLMHPGVKATEEQVVAALTAKVREHHRFLLRELLELIEVQDRAITRLEAEIERHLSPFEEEIERCEQIDFSEPTGSRRLDGGDRNRSPTVSRCRTPELPSRESVQARSESAGKRLSGRARKGNRYLRAALVQAAHGVRRSRTYLGEQYRRLKKRRGSKRAALAVGHSILVIYYQMMKTGEEYHEKGEAFFARKERGKVEQQLVRRLERMGYQITRPSQPVA